MLNPIGATDSGSKPLLAVAQGLGSKGFLENYGFYAAHSEIRKWLSVERLGGFVKELFGTYLRPPNQSVRLQSVRITLGRDESIWIA